MSFNSYVWEGNFSASELIKLLPEYDTYCVVEKNKIHIYGISYNNINVLYLDIYYDSNILKLNKGYRYPVNDIASYTMIDMMRVQGLMSDSMELVGEIFYLNGTSFTEAFTLYYSRNIHANKYQQAAAVDSFSRQIKSAIIGNPLPKLRSAPVRMVHEKNIHGVQFNVS